MSSTHAALPFWRRYIFSTDHKIIGLQYILTAAFMAVVSVALSVLIRMQMAWPARLWPIMERLLPAAYEGGALKPRDAQNQIRIQIHVASRTCTAGRRHIGQ